jgi:SAM-dependent methyltransferase
MAFLKMWRTIKQHGPRTTLKKVAQVGPTYLGGVKGWRARRCQCCQRVTIFIVQQNGSAESRSCLFCSANERYELLAAEIRSRYGNKLPQMAVLELDPHSPLKPLLAQARTYTRSFYEEGCHGPKRNGAVCEDITALSFQNNSFDLIVSSEVLEHVPQLEKALMETTRVLKVGGAHLFTVPPRLKTKKRAEVNDGKVVHIEPPDYHLDPLLPQGILAFWDIGPDLSAVIPCPGLDIKIVRGPVGEAGRVVWMAEKVAS